MASRQIIQHSGDLAALGYFSQTYVAHVRKGDHDSQAIGDKTEQVKALLLSTEGTETDVLDSSNAVIRIDDFLADLKGHARTSFVKGNFSYGTASSLQGACV
jgi:hypothetical protein